MTVRLFRLTPTVPAIPVGLQFEAGWCYISNPTGSPVLLRVGNPSFPTSDNTDYTIPALGKEAITVVGREFGVAFADATLLSTNVKGNVASTCTVLFGTPNEPVPQFGAASFQTLSLSDFTGVVAFAGVTVVPTLDIGAWGGAQIFVSPSAGSGQGVIQVDVSQTGATFYPLGTYAFWPNVPLVINVPRVVRRINITFNATAIVGEPAIAGNYAIRATITEIQNLAYNVSTQAITKTFNMAASGAQQYTFVAVGVPAISIAAIATAGTGASAAVTLLVEATSNLIDWRKVTERTQRMSQGITLYRALGNLDLFIRVTVFEVSGISALVGSLYLSIPREADTGYILNTIQQSLGDSSAPSNTNQDIYHELDTIRGWDASIDNRLITYLPYLQTIDADTGNLASMLTQEIAMNAHLTTLENYESYLPGMNGHLVTMENYESYLPTMGGDVTTSRNYLNNINTNIGSILGQEATNLPYLPLIKAQTDNLSTILTRLTSILADLDAGLAATTKHFSVVTTVVAGVNKMTGFSIPAGSKVVAFQFNYDTASNVVASVTVRLGFGTTVALVEWAQTIYCLTNTVLLGGQGPTVKLDNSGSAGYALTSANNVIWVFASTAGDIAWNIWYV